MAMWDHGATRDPADPAAAGQAQVMTDHGEHGERHKERTMSKRGRKRRARKTSGANHGKRPNA
jgi:hypothetical protein